MAVFKKLEQSNILFCKCAIKCLVSNGKTPTYSLKTISSNIHNFEEEIYDFKTTTDHL